MNTMCKLLGSVVLGVVLFTGWNAQAQTEIPDQWYLNWFGELGLYGEGDDPDMDGLSNLQEYNYLTHPNNWDSDGDALDDYWEKQYDATSIRLADHLDPLVANVVTVDADGDGLSYLHEYYGVDNEPRMELDTTLTLYHPETTNVVGGVTNIVPASTNYVYVGKSSANVDDLSPITIDTDNDYLVDSFEVAWYDPANGIDPLSGDPASQTGDVARADTDEDGLSNYREQCLLHSMNMGQANGDKWDWPIEDRWPFYYTDYTTDLPSPHVIKIVTMVSFLNLNLQAALPTHLYTNRFQLRNHAWTDPTEETGYNWVDEDIPPGHDTDNDELPDGWEVDFGLDPRDPGTVATGWTNGPWGDPDGDMILNWYEYLGQDGNRFATKPYVNGTGDETNPNEHRWRPDSTYRWQWFPENAPYNWLTNPRHGSQLSRIEALGAALPGTPLTGGTNCINASGLDAGTDTDDDGITDREEIYPQLTSLINKSCSPVYSCSPFIHRSALITHADGIKIPDPEPEITDGLRPAGTRDDLQWRNWTIECMVKMADLNLSGNLFNFVTALGPTNRIIYRLSLENNAPKLQSQNEDGVIFEIMANELPTNQWINLAGVWDHENNSLSLYINGVIAQQMAVYGECASGLIYPATNELTLASSADGSFVNSLYIDEVRIWGIARPPSQISTYAGRLVPQGPSDDAWLENKGDCEEYYQQYDFLLVNGGSMFVGEPGQELANVYVHYVKVPAEEVYYNFWIDDGDGQYNKARDEVLYLSGDKPLLEGQLGLTIAAANAAKGDEFPYDVAYYNDKDGSGDFSRNSIRAYFRFDDGGSSAEDFARKAKSSLLGSTAESYTFGDFGYALATNNFSWETNGAAVVYGAVIRGADDSDQDGMSDSWEMINNLNAYDNGTIQETSVGAKNGPFGALGDPDGDGLINIYEYWAETNPRASDSNGDGQQDSQEDFDGDDLVNITEQALGSRPDLVDTDDDALPDNEEQGSNTSPANPADPPVSRSLVFGGAATDYVEIPQNEKFQLQSWSLEAAVQPRDLTGGTILRRVVQQIAGSTNAMNYFMAIEPDGAAGLQLACGYVQLDGTEYVLRAGNIPVGTNEWTYVGVTYDADKATMTIYTNGYLVSSTNNMFRAPPRSGKGGETYVRFGESFSGNIDEIRIWDYARTETEMQEGLFKTMQPDTTGLAGYFRFNDGQATTNYFPFGPYHQPAGPQDYTYEADWNAQWRHAGVLHGSVRFQDNGAGILPALVYIYLEEEVDTPAGYWEADGAAAGWNVDTFSEDWKESGRSVALEVGDEYLIVFRDINGWNSPDNVALSISNSATMHITNYYRYVGVSTSGPYCISGEIANHSSWTNGVVNPGDGSGMGQLVVGIWSSDSDPIGSPITNQTRLSRSPCTNLPISVDYGLGPLPDLSYLDYYQLRAWVDGNANQAYDLGEPASDIKSISDSQLANGVSGVNLEIVDDTDTDELPDWYEVHSFGDLRQSKDGDYDNDGLSNYQEYNIPLAHAGISTLNGGDYDTDGDGMDDKWEYDRYAGGYGLNPSTNDAWIDMDGDGLFNVQEYLGVDGIPRLEQDYSAAPGVAFEEESSEDDLDPRNYDTDGDWLVDSFELAWYNPTEWIDPKTNLNVDISADLDVDGMSTYREQCMLVEFAQGGNNDIWSVGYLSMPGPDLLGVQAFSPPLIFSTTGITSVAQLVLALRQEEWTDPTDEDTDSDLLPDGWETEHSLDPSSSVNANGYWGDPDADNLNNYQEYLGQDAQRGTTNEFINGSGDETNPNEYNWVLASTGPGYGVARAAILSTYWNHYATAPIIGTLGAGRPTISLGAHTGSDTDDDGLNDDVEIQQAYYNKGALGSSPVHSMSPFIKRAVIITNAAGMLIPDPEGYVNGYSPFLHGPEWTIECYVKCGAQNSSGYLINNPGPSNVTEVTYRLELSNNVPILSFDTLQGFRYSVTGKVLPTNQWIYLAGVWNPAHNSLALYVDGIFLQEQQVYESAMSGNLFASVTNVSLGASADGSFVNTLKMDEIRIWTKARSNSEIEEYRRKLVVQTSEYLKAYFRFDDGGVSAEDFARKALNTGLGAVRTNYYYGDMGYAIRSGYRLDSNDYAEVIGADWRGADDSDGDGMADAWEMMNHLDPFSTNGVNGANADADGDGLKNIYEYWSDTNPWADITAGDAVLDVAGDRDGDTVVNLIEQQLLSRPDLVDTDDDSLTDNQERNMGTNPADPVDPAVGRALVLGGASTDYMQIPASSAQRLLAWTLEAWVKPDSVSGGQGYILRRTIEKISGVDYAQNFAMGLRSDGSGGLEAYSGYVLVDGTAYSVGGGTIPVGEWTHVAATYDSAASLRVYVNGGQVAVLTNANYAPPINGGGGDTFVRVGEDIDGSIDDIRIWSVARKTNEITANMNIAIDGATAGLVNYFRMDDSEAVATEFPFGPYHQPFGAQDFTYTKDWNEQWIHAAELHGSAAFEDVQNSGPVVIQPTVQVVLYPEDVVAAGAEWSLNGNGWNASEAIVTAPSGTNRITFRTIDGWVTPQSLTLLLTNNMTLSTNIYYTHGGAIRIELEPPEAVSAGAKWSIDGGASQESGSVVSNLAPGAYLVEYSQVTSWDAPASEYVTILESQTIELVREYSQERGSITVNISPNSAIADGAVWRLNGGSWQSSGTRANVSSGNFTVEYRDVTGWLSPQSTVLAVSNGQDFILSGVYYNYEFIGEFGFGEGQFSKPSGLAVDLSGNLYVSDTGNNRIQIRYVDGTWGVIGSAGSGVGQLNQPYGLSIAGDGRLYVADANNHRVQCYNLFDQSWTVWGGTPSSAVGSFNAPFDVEQDAAGNLYVADRSNHRVQRKAVNGTWSVLLSSGFGLGQLRYPRGLAMDDRGYLYVSDYVTGTTNKGRVQKFSSAGAYIDLVASSSSDLGALAKPAGITVYGTNLLYIADNLTNAVVSRALSSPTFSQVIGSAYLKGPEDVAVDRDGNLYIADTKHNRIIKLNIGTITPVGRVETNQYQYRNDFDGDGKADNTINWNAGGWWYITYSSGGTASKQLGSAGTIPACGDYDGDGKTDLAVYKASDGTWSIVYSSGGHDVITWGWNEAMPVPGDYDGDGKTDICVFWPAGGEWFIKYSGGGSAKRNWGWSDTEPVVGDYDGDLRTDLAVYWPAQGKWFICESSTARLMLIQWGWSEADSAPGDYDGDGKADAAVYHALSGTWIVRMSSTSSMYRKLWGWSEACGVPADFDGDGKTDFAVYYAAEGYWIIFNSSDQSTTTLNWGWGATVPIY